MTARHPRFASRRARLADAIATWWFFSRARALIRVVPELRAEIRMLRAEVDALHAQVIANWLMGPTCAVCQHRPCDCPQPGTPESGAS